MSSPQKSRMSSQLTGSHRFPTLLSGVGLFGLVVAIVERISREIPHAAPVLFAGLISFGMFWLAVLVLRTGERMAHRTVSPFDRTLTYFSGPAACLLMVFVARECPAWIEEINGINRFRSATLQTVFEILMASGLVISLCCLVSRRGAHVPPRLLWKLVCLPPLIVYGGYALLTPIGCSAERLRMH